MPQESQSLPPPKTVISAKIVNLVLVSYTDDSGAQVTQLAIAGDNHVHLLNSKEIGFRKDATPSGLANDWLADGVFEKIQSRSGN